jgi:hypothetical protein
MLMSIYINTPRHIPECLSPTLKIIRQETGLLDKQYVETLRPAVRSNYVPECQAQVGIEYVCGQIHTHTQKKGQINPNSITLEPDRQQQHRSRLLCYRPAVFFRHLSLIGFSFEQKKILKGKKMARVSKILFQTERVLNLHDWKYRKTGSVCRPASF